MHTVWTHVRALVAYLIAAVAFSWPLAARLGTHLTGPPSGDTGVYVWNLWVFRHELVTHGRTPFATTSIFSLAPGIDLSQHNYTVFSNLVALPLLPILGVVATFNVIYLAQVVLTAYATFLLARHVVGRTLEAWLAGMLFAWSPWLVARGTEHFSLAAAAPLPIFLLCLINADRTRLARWGAACGIALAWAALCDPYYAVYCLFMGGVYAVCRIFQVHRSPALPPGGGSHGRRQASGGLRLQPEVKTRLAGLVLNVLLVVAAGITLWIASTGGGEFTMAGQRVAMRSLYTPVLALTTLALIRVLVWLRPTVRLASDFTFAGLFRLALFAVLSTLVLLSPVLYRLGLRIADGRYVPVPTYWRTSMPGVDLLSFLLPNPNHPLFRDLTHDWLATRPNGLVENVASLPLVMLLVMAIAYARVGFRPRRFWLVLTIASAAMALGPFVVVAGTPTYVPGPWALFRYLPVIDIARAPTRFTVLAMLGCSILFAQALGSLIAPGGWRRHLKLTAVGLVLAAELCASPRVLHSAQPSPLFLRVARDPARVLVLTVPTGFRDGLSETGGFNTETQFLQTVHEKPLVGGYLSRISSRRKNFYRGHPVLHALYVLSEGRSLTSDEETAARAKGRGFLRRARVGYVIVDRARATRDLTAFVESALRLQKIDEDDRYTLYLPLWRTEPRRLSVAVRAQAVPSVQEAQRVQ